MHKNRRAKFFRRREKIRERGVVQVHAIHIGSNLRARKTKLLHTAFKFAHRKRGVLHRHGCQRNESIRHCAHNAREVIVEQLRQVVRVGGLGAV